MQVESEERKHRLAVGLCLYCASPDHIIRACPVKPPRPSVSTMHQNPVISKLTSMSVQLVTPECTVSVSALVDSSSSGNFISQSLLSRLQLPCCRHAQELRVETIQGKPLGCGRVKFQAPPLILKLGSSIKRRGISWYWREPWSISSWDAPGSRYILRKSGGIHVR